MSGHDEVREDSERQRALGAAAEHHRLAGRLTTVSAELFFREKAAREAAERRLAAVEAVVARFEEAATSAPGHIYSGPWLAMVDDIRTALATGSDQ